MKTALAARSVSVLLLILFCFKTVASYSQVAGCRDPYAYNYDPSATVNDGSCKYNTTNYTPPVLVDSISNVLKETSGLQMAGNYLWSFNDSKGQAAIYRLDTVKGAILQTVNLEGATNVDWEDIAFDGTYFYIGDFGNNETGARTDLKIYKFKFSDIPADYSTNFNVTIAKEQIQVITFKYNDQVSFVPTITPNTTSFDCEAMIVDGGKIHLFSKDWNNSNSGHYVINSTNAGDYIATRIETLATGYMVTGADKAVGKNIIALIGYETPQNLGVHHMHILSDFSKGFYFNGNARKINLPYPNIMGQAEGITFKNATYGYISSEQFTYFGTTVNQKLRYFTISDFVPLYVLPVELKNFSVVNTKSGHKINWSFAAPVQQLKVQYSSNGAAFTDLKTYSTSITDEYYHTITAAGCYRLGWKKDNGAYNYSSIICVKSNDKNTIDNLSVKWNGELNFTVNGNEPVHYAFKLITTDGKLIAQLKEQSYLPGSYSVNFLKDLPTNQVVFLIMYNNTERKSRKLLVYGE